MTSLRRVENSQGARQLFRTTAAPMMVSALCLGLSALAGSALAAPQIDVWSHETTGNTESLVVSWTESGDLSVQEFPAARQFVVRIPGAIVADGLPSRLTPEGNTNIRSARLQAVTMPDGRPGTQLTVNLHTWTPPSIQAADSALTIAFSETSSPAGERLLLSNADFALLDTPVDDSYGAIDAPASGAGQSDIVASPQFDAFYVPPDAGPMGSTALAAGDEGMMRTAELFNRTVDLDFKDGDLQNIIRSIARRLQLNIIMMPGQVTGRVTVSLNNVRLGDAFDALLKASNLAYTLEPGGIVRVVPRSDVRGSEKELGLRSIPVNWLDAADLADIIDPFLSTDGKVQSATQSNFVIVQDVPENLAKITELVQRLDVPEKQVRMEVRLVDLTEEASRSLGVSWRINSVSQFTGLPGGGSVPNTGVTFPFAPEAFPAASLVFQQRGSFGIFGETYNVDAAIAALEQRGEAITLASPRIMSLNNVEASIEIVRQLPYQDAVTDTQGNVPVIRFSDIGTRARITPRITNHGFVTMDIETEQRIFVGISDERSRTPIVDERLANTSVTVRDEQTVALGGLRQFETNTTESGVPWLLRLPAFGWLFRSTAARQTRLELHMFVTPSILKDPEPTIYERAMFDKIDYNWDLPDYYFDEMRARRGPDEHLDPNVKHP